MTLTPWQRTNILGALNYLKDISRVKGDNRAEMLVTGLMEVLDPSRRTVRLQREAAQAAAAGAQAGRDRRAGKDRRARERRKQHVSFGNSDRRRGRDRRTRERRAG